MKFTVKLCPLARKHHQESARQFAHVFHRKNIICVTPEFYDLPQTFRVGILLHELGHIAFQDYKHSEREADNIIRVISGVQVFRRTYRGLPRLECIKLA